jgi:hypothetical protein
MFCSVARGKLKEVTNDEDDDWTKVTMSVTKLYRHTLVDPDRERVFSQNSISTNLEGVVHFPNNCRANVAAGEYLLMGNVKLGLPIVTCAPTWREWQLAIKAAAAKKSLNCRVDF